MGKLVEMIKAVGHSDSVCRWKYAIWLIPSLRLKKPFGSHWKSLAEAGQFFWKEQQELRHDAPLLSTDPRAELCLLFTRALCNPLRCRQVAQF